MQRKENIENQDPKSVRDLTDKQVATALLGADQGQFATHSCIQEYYHSVDVHTYPDQRRSLDGSTVLVEKVERKDFLELTYRGEGFVAKARNETLPVHFQELLSVQSSIQGSVVDSEAIALSIETNSAANNQKNIAR